MDPLINDPVRELERIIEELREQVAELKYDLQEANSEIDRHHRDFADIRRLSHTMMGTYAINRIRAIVG